MYKKIIIKKNQTKKQIEQASIRKYRLIFKISDLIKSANENLQAAMSLIEEI